MNTFQKPYIELALTMFNFGPVNKEQVDRDFGTDGEEEWDLVLKW